MTLSIIIVNYKTPILLLECVKSIYTDTTLTDFEVIVVDNNSKDNSEELLKTNFKDVRWINLSYNSGFAYGNNIGIQAAKGDYICLLNPDSYVQNNFFKKLLGFYYKKDESGDLGLLSCRIISSNDKQLLIGSGIGFPSIQKHIKANPIYIYLTRRFNTKRPQYQAKTMHYKNHNIDFVSGACVMIKKSKVIEKDLMLDEDFFLYFEDVEWSYRVKKCGYHNYFFSDIELYHVNAASTSLSLNRNFQIQISEYLYLYKTHRLATYYLIGLLIQFNYSLSKMLFKRKKEQQKLIHLQEEEIVFRKYFKQIPEKYNKPSPNNKRHLIYAE